MNKSKNYINVEVLFEQKTDVKLVDFISKTIEKRALRFSPTYKQNYLNIIKHLNDFSEITDCTIYTNSINEEKVKRLSVDNYFRI